MGRRSPTPPRKKEDYMKKLKNTTPRQPRSVALATYVQSIIIAVLVTGVAAFIAGYFANANISSDARQAVHAEIQASRDLVKKDEQ